MRARNKFALLPGYAVHRFWATSARKRAAGKGWAGVRQGRAAAGTHVSERVDACEVAVGQRSIPRLRTDDAMAPPGTAGRGGVLCMTVLRSEGRGGLHDRGKRDSDRRHSGRSEWRVVAQATCKPGPGLHQK